MKHWVSGLFLAVLLAGTAFSQDATFTDFSAARFLDPENDRRLERSFSVHEYGPRELNALGARDLAGALQLITGGQVLTGEHYPGRQETYLRIRGQSSGASRIYLDGVPISDGLTGTLDLTRVPLNQVALVRVITGPSSSRFGPGNIGGTVEVFTRQVKDRFSTSFGTDWGTGEALLYRLWLGDTQGPFNYFGAASHDERDHWYLSEAFGVDVNNEKGGERENSDLKRDSFRGRAGLMFDETFQIFVGGSYDEDQKGIPRTLEPVEKHFDRYGHRRRTTGHATLLSKPSKFFELRASGYITENARRLDRFGDPDFEFLDQEYHQRDLRYGGRLLPTLDFGNASRIRLMGEIQRDEVENWVQGDPRLFFATTQSHIALEDEVFPWKFLGLSVGVSYDRLFFNWVEANENIHPMDAFSPRAGLTLGPFYGAELYFSAAEKTRFPSLFEMFDEDFGNPDLDPEEALLFEAGFRHVYKTFLSSEVSAFQTRVSDKIRRRYEPEKKRFTFHENAGDCETTGATIRFSSEPIEGLFARVDYTYLVSRFEAQDDDDDWPDEIFFVPEHRGNALFGYKSPIGIGGAVGATGTSEQSDPEADRRGDLPYFSLVHARLFYNYRENLEISLSAENLLDVYYETSRDYPMPGRFLHGGLSLMF